MLSNKAKKLCAEILVEQGYADKISNGKRPESIYYYAMEGYVHAIKMGKAGYQEPNQWQKVDITSDTLEARRQANVVEDWLPEEHFGTWVKSGYIKNRVETKHQLRIHRIVWCLNKLTEGNNEPRTMG